MLPRGRKTYVLDTSVLMHDPERIESLKDNEIVIPGPVLQELGDLMHANDERKKFQAREATRAIEAYDASGSLASEQGVPTKVGGILRIEMRSVTHKKLPVGYIHTQLDNQILQVALFIAQQQKARRDQDRRRVVLISKDVNLRHRAKACLLEAEDYKSDKVEDFMSALYGGVAEIKLKEGGEETLSLLYRNSSMPVSELCSIAASPGQITGLYENQCIFLTTASHKTAQAIFKKGLGIVRLVRPMKDYKEERDRIVPRNELQAFALGLLDDRDIGVVTLVGIAGAGKTLLALKWAYENLNNGNGYKRIIVFRSNTEAGKRLGFLPGDLNEKFAPWKDPVYMSLDLLTKHRVKEKGDGSYRERGENSIIEHLENSRELIVMPPNFSRGATYHDSIIVIDDAQNLPMKLAQLLITRAGENSRVIITGDPTQIDDPFLDAASCGLVQAAIRFRGDPLCASIFLPKSERSKIAELAARLLN